MEVLGEKAIEEFTKKHERSRKPLARFLEIVRAATWKHMPDVKATFPATDFDRAEQTYIFEIGGNKYRLLAAIDFDEQVISIEAVLTHQQYTKQSIKGILCQPPMTNSCLKPAPR